MDGSCPNDDWRVQSLAVKAAPLSPSATCAEVRRLLWQNPAQSLVAVVDGDRPVGMIVRSDLFSTMARPYYPELYDRRPISDLMMRHPIVVDADCDVDELGAIIHADRPDEYTIGFIVTEAGRYCGIGSTQRLLGMIARKARWQQRAVEAALQRAAQASEAKSMFLANVSHELRTPLNAIMGFSALMQGQAFGQIGNGRYLGYLEDIHSSGQHLLAVINDLIDLARAESGRLDIEDDDVDLAEIVAGALRMIGVRAASAGLTVATDMPAMLPRLRADGRRLRQVLLNLLSNAVIS
jgi:two-component system cell cycle sensor histidine kinase PleC